MRLELARIAIWSVSVTIIFTVHHHTAEQWRKTADRAAASVNEYMAREGHCPESLDRWMSAAEAKSAGIYYFCSDGRPGLVYMDSFEAAARYYYRFETHTWEWNSG